MKPYYENKPASLEVSQSSLKHFPPHLHINIELMYIDEGPSTIVVDGELLSVETGDLVVVFPNVIHSYDNETFEQYATFVIFNNDFFDESISTYMNFKPVQPVIKAEFLHEDIRYAIKSLLKENNKIDFNSEAAKSLIHLILARISPVLEFEKINYCRGSDIISDLVSFICNNFTEQISLDMLSEAFGLNKYYISRIFNEKIKISLNDYTNSLRIDMAKKLLKSSVPMSILEVSERCGFETQRSFNRVFKNFCGVSPSEFKKI